LVFPGGHSDAALLVFPPPLWGRVGRGVIR
jgi:hypothetical protein